MRRLTGSRSLRNPILLCLLLLPFQLLAGPDFKPGVLKGRILTSDGQPAAGVTVRLDETPYSTMTGDEGRYELRARPGSYRLIISFIGTETKSQPVEIEEGQTLVLPDITLEESAAQLKEVVISASKNNPLANKESGYVARMPLKNLENPQVYNVISHALLQQQMIVSFDDALKNAPGVDKLWSSTGRGGDGAGYFSMRGFSVQPTIRNGIAGLTNGSPDPANIERIETIKGPSGTLFGSSLISFGGLINIVTRQPYDTFGGAVAYTGGGYGLNRVTADVNTPLNREKTLLFRANAAYHYEGSFQDAGFRKSLFLAPSLSYQVNDRLSVLLDGEFYQSESTNPEMLFMTRSQKLGIKNAAELPIGYKRSYTADDITIRNPTTNLYGQVTYKLSGQWTSQTNVSRSIRKSDGLYSYMWLLPGDSSLSRLLSHQNATAYYSDIQQNFTGDFLIGGFRNRLVAGLDFSSARTDNGSSAYITFDTVSITHPDPRYTELTRLAVEERLAGSANPARSSSVSHTYSAYASDVVNLTDRLMLMLSLRIDHFDNNGTYNQKLDTTTGGYAQTALSPKFGLTYQLIKDRLSLFGNYMNGFKNVAPGTQPDGTVVTFDPQQANQWEAGLKMELLDKKLTATLSYYDIYVTNMVRSDPDKPGFSLQDGNQSSKGLEADIILNPVPGLNIVAGYSFNKSTNDNANPDIDGLRPTSAGPEHLANAWISYRLVNGPLQGLGFGFGGNYASENKVTNSRTTGVFVLPAYTVTNASLFYDRPAYRIGLKLDNLANKKYWKGWTTVEPQMLRRFSASIALKL